MKSGPSRTTPILPQNEDQAHVLQVLSAGGTIAELADGKRVLRDAPGAILGEVPAHRFRLLVRWRWIAAPEDGVFRDGPSMGITEVGRRALALYRAVAKRKRAAAP